tara:strand:+ start:1251 stop:1454 length:204 start_codon:yes stop_codon:yes gene_type:complete
LTVFDKILFLSATNLKGENMSKYGCDYCEEPLCPELCDEAKAAHNNWVNSEEFKKLQESREPLDFVL